jgi:hypothetical protein
LATTRSVTGSTCARSIFWSRRLALFLAEHAARHRGVKVPADNRGGHLAMLVRGGCTLAPDSHLFAVIDRAFVAELEKLDKR